MTVYIKLTIAGDDVGPFDLYSDSDGFSSPFATDIPRQDLIDGQQYSVDDATTQIKVQSTGNYTNYIIIYITTPITTTTTTTIATTTTTTTSEPVTTTTTTTEETFYRVMQCGNEAMFTVAKTDVVILFDNLVFNTIPPDGHDYCGQVVDINFTPGPATATIVSPISYECTDDVHCYQLP